MLLKKCCCCVDLRTGAIIIAILGILGALGNMGEGFSWVAIISTIVGLVAHGCLLFGAIKYHRVATLINLIISMLGIILMFIIAIIALVSIFRLPSGCSENLNCHAVETGLAVTVGMYIPGGILAIYLWMCVYSFYQELKMGATNSV